MMKWFMIAFEISRILAALGVLVVAVMDGPTWLFVSLLAYVFITLIWSLSERMYQR